MKPLTSIALLLLLVNRALHLHPLLVIELVHLVHLCGLLLARRRVRSQAGVAGGRPQNTSELHNFRHSLKHLVPSGSPPQRQHIEPQAELSTLPENWERANELIRLSDQLYICR